MSDQPRSRADIYRVIDRMNTLLVAALQAEGKSYAEAEQEADELLADYDWQQRQPIHEQETK